MSIYIQYFEGEINQVKEENKKREKERVNKPIN